MHKSKFWFKNEKNVMKRLGLNSVPGSGSDWIHKEDGESDTVMVQLKSTEADSYRVNYLDIEKLEYHAQVAHKIPIFLVEFLGRGTYMMLNVDDLEDLKSVCFGGSLYLSENTSSVNTMPADIDIQEPPKHFKKVKSGSNSSRNKFYEERDRQWQKKKR